MTYFQFLTNLFEDGRVVVPEGPISASDLNAGDEVIAGYEIAWRANMPGEPPEFSSTAARWAAVRFFRACQLTVYRDVDAETIERELCEPLKCDVSPAACYSIDLVLRYLPDLAKFAATASEHDPLVAHLHRWAHEWPLSSVGMAEIGDVTIDTFAEDASLMQLYVDRVIATGDKSRLADERVRDVVETAIGMYPELSEAMSKASRENAETT